jgi:hypothetical protein
MSMNENREKIIIFYKDAIWEEWPIRAEILPIWGWGGGG